MTTIHDLHKDLLKKYGPNILVDPSIIRTDIKVCPTGIFSVDMALGVGGFPRGRITEIFGPEASGKTSLVLAAISEVQKSGGCAALIDMEQSFDYLWAETLGVDVENNFSLFQPENAEQALDIAEDCVRSGVYDIVSVDSIAALVPLKELEGTMEDNTVGLQARLVGKALRKINPAVNHTDTAFILINQLRMKVGVMYGNPETTPGGRAPSFYSAVRLEVRLAEKVKDGSDISGQVSKVTVKKNKVAPPQKVALFTFDYETGIDKIGSVIDVAIELGIIKKAGAWFSYGEQRFQGAKGTREVLGSNKELYDKILSEVKTKITALPVTEQEQI